uniref:U5 small nuclear ribonucleoprotein helicase n=2 Tax=Aceria tosichella TaxID=561515 RepID=A0A6G1SEP0_9ACAR
MATAKRRKNIDCPTKLRLEDLNENISIADIDIKDLLYQPKSELTSTVYGLIIKFVGRKLGFQHNSIINGTADDVIATMKNPNLDEASRRSEIKTLISSDDELDDDEYNELCNLCKKIDDWDSDKTKTKDDTAGDGADAIGVIVSDDESASDEYLSEVRDSDDEFDLDEMFEKEKKDSDGLDLEELAKKQSTIVPKIDIGEPVRREGFHEYNIVPKKRHSYRNEDLIQIEDLSEYERKAFPDLKTLNYIQSKIYKRAMSSDHSLLICAPTGAGKTNIALLTMLREILKHPLTDKAAFDTSKFKIIYIAPIKALVQEIVENFTKKLGGPPFNLVVEELTGDHQLDQKQISRAQLIVCTPEKWDIVTRKSVDRLYTKLVRLVIFDEIHLLHNERGATLEALVARIKRHKYIEGDNIRIIGLSATLPNYKDVSRFISPDDTIENSTFFFDSSYRPIPLRQQYIALTESKKVFRMINDIVYEKVIERLAEKSQILIFVHSRPDTFKTAEFIKTKALEEQKVPLLVTSEASIERINEYGKNLGHKLKELLQFGIGTHHAGMSKYERSCVEDLFRGKYIRVLVSTATLAWGVNLPARTVIIKGTQVYRDGRWTDLDSLDVTQMLGRAGRPGFDKEGEGIVITQQSKVAFYISLMTEQLPVESKLIGRLAEFINAECVIGNVENLESAVNWISETYLNSRMLSVIQQDNRQYMAMYGINPDARHNDPKLVQHRNNLAYNAASLLDERGLIVFDRSSGTITSTELGRIASNFNCSSRTIKLFYDSIHEYTTDIELFRIFSLADEFKDIFVRRGEEADLATMINQVPFPIDDRRATAGANKVNVLLQVYIFHLNIEGSDLICDMHFIKDNAARIARAIYEIVLMKGFASVAELSLDFCRKIDLRMTSCHSPLRRFADDLEPEIIKQLERKNYHIDELRVLDAEKLGKLLQKSGKPDYDAGKRVYQLLKYLPKLKIEASIKPVSKKSLRIDLIIRQNFTWSEKYHGNSQRLWLFVEDVNQERLLYHEIIYLRKYMSTEDIAVAFYVPYLMPAHPFYYLRIFPDGWFGCDHHLPLYIDKLLLPDEPFSTTQLLDIDPVRIRSLENQLFERYYSIKFKGSDFNQIQTQSFKHLYKSDDDIILLAPAGSGKTTCAELAIIHNINLKGTSSKCAYVAPNAQAAQMVYDNWKTLFEHYGVMQLTGNHRSDAARVDDGKMNIVIGDAERWHILSLVRSKKYRKLFNKFQLFIIDDIHRLHSDKNSTLEWLCSKIRLLTKLNIDSPSRIITLGSPVACADNLRSWLSFERGSKEPILLNYPLSIRPVKLELVVQRYHHYDYNMRFLTMHRPAYRLVNHMSRGKPALVFVSDFNRAKDIAETFIRYSTSEGRRFVFPRTNLERVREPELRECLGQGVGYVYLGMDPSDRKIVESLFESEQILVLIATVSTCWSIQCRSNLTIVMDTQQHDGYEGTDYDLSDIIQMVGLTGRPLSDHGCKCVIMCHSSKADHYDRLLREPLPVESRLPKNLINFVNYEVSTGTIVELNNIYKPYLAHTYFYKRISINPNYYGVIVPDDTEQKARAFGTFFNNLVNKIALELEKTEFMTMEGSHENPTFTAGLLAKISLEYYINYATLVNYNKWLSTDSKLLDLRPIELIELLSTNTIEFEQIFIRNGELSFLKELKWRYKLRDSDQLDSSSHKIKLLILSQYQKTDGREDRVEGELIEDRRYILTMAYRLLMAIVDIAWLKDSFHLAKTAIQLSKKLTPFYRSSKPSIDMDISLAREGEMIKIEVTIDRADDPFSHGEYLDKYHSLPSVMYRDEGWCFLINGKSRVKRDDSEKFVLFKRVKTPNRGRNEYKLEFELTENTETYLYELFFMSDFYSTKEDRLVSNIDIGAISKS